MSPSMSSSCRCEEADQAQEPGAGTAQELVTFLRYGSGEDSPSGVDRIRAALGYFGSNNTLCAFDHRVENVYSPNLS